MEKAFEKAGFTPEGLPNENSIRILSAREVVAQGCTGVCEFTESRIKLSFRGMYATVEGDELTFSSLNSGAVSVKGKIIRVSYL